jgi:hypothetical protein
LPGAWVGVCWRPRVLVEGAGEMKRAIGAAVLGLSACGYPLTQFAVRRWGVRGAAVAECACAGLAIRDTAMIASGVPRRLRAVPAALLRLELAAGVAAALAGLSPLLDARSADRSAPATATAADTVRRRRHVVRGAYGQVRDLPQPRSGPTGGDGQDLVSAAVIPRVGASCAQAAAT